MDASRLPVSAPLAADDGYGAELVDWRARFDAWQARFDAWDGTSLLEPPPKVPKPTKWLGSNAGLVSRRKAAYDAATAECVAARALWEPTNKQRKKDVKKHGRPDSDGRRATQQRQEQPELAQRHCERELARQKDKALGPAVVRRFNLAMQQLEQEELSRLTGVEIAGAPSREQEAGSDAGSDASSDAGSDAAVRQNLWQLRMAAEGVCEYRQEAGMEAELIAVRRVPVHCELLRRLRAVTGLQASCQAARGVLVERLESARAELDAAFAAYLQQYPSQEEIVRIHASPAGCAGLGAVVLSNGPVALRSDR